MRRRRLQLARRIERLEELLLRKPLRVVVVWSAPLGHDAQPHGQPRQPPRPGNGRRRPARRRTSSSSRMPRSGWHRRSTLESLTFWRRLLGRGSRSTFVLRPRLWRGSLGTRSSARRLCRYPNGGPINRAVAAVQLPFAKGAWVRPRRTLVRQVLLALAQRKRTLEFGAVQARLDSDCHWEQEAALAAKQRLAAMDPAEREIEEVLAEKKTAGRWRVE